MARKKKYANKERELLRKTVKMRDAIWEFWRTQSRLVEEGFLGIGDFDKNRKPLEDLLNETIIELKTCIFDTENPQNLI